jgi:hypothetical protein
MSPNGARSRLFPVVLGLLACAAMALAVSASLAATSAKTAAIVLGKTPKTPKPNCPTPKGDNVPADQRCQAMGRVTGFQISADGRRGPYKVRQPGRIVAWGIDLSRPAKDEQEFFAEVLEKSGPPSARLSVLKSKGHQEFKLVKQSPVVQLQPYLGHKPVFTLTDPLKVRKGLVVALTTPTWVSNLADAGADNSDAWRTSRDSGACGTETNDSAEENEADLTKRSRPQQKVGGVRAYACKYTGARILYRAYLAPRGGSGGGGGGGGGGGNGGGGNGRGGN